MSKSQVLSLYKALLQSSTKFSSYNFRHYFLRRIKHSFRELRSVSDQSEIDDFYNEGVRNLEIIKRQVIIAELYRTDPLIIEKFQKNKKQDL